MAKNKKEEEKGGKKEDGRKEIGLVRNQACEAGEQGSILVNTWV